MKYICSGRVLPERANVSFPAFEMPLDQGGKALISCDASQIAVILEGAPYDGFVSARLAAKDIANIVVGSLGFTLGCGYSVDMIQVIEETGHPKVFGVQPVGVDLRIGFENRVLDRAAELSGRDLFFRLAVRDYLLAMTEEMDCGTYCFRAIEGIKSSFVHASGKDRWDEMHSTLGTDKNTINTTVKLFADAPRHGKWLNAQHTNSGQRAKMLTLTRDILQNYLNYKNPQPTTP